MEIKMIDNQTIEIQGNIKSLDDYSAIKNATTSLVSKGATSITVNIKDSLSMVSSVIGHFIKLINVEHVRLHVHVCDERLYNLLDQLNLIHTFNVTRIKN